ncbi:hypothetical protein FWH30_01815 [Microgenomates group bacterium]|nr:hypothetical protein [Microgenomates group bacterium]
MPKVKKPTIFDNLLLTISAGVVVAVVFILLSIVFIIYPTVRSILILQETIATEEQLLEKLNTRARQIAAARQQISLHQEDIDNLGYAFTDEYSYVQDFKILERIASDITSQGYNFILLRLSISKMPDESVPINRSNNPYVRKDATYSLTVNADFAGAIAFLQAIKDNRRNFRIDTVNFGSADTGGATNLLEVSIILTNIDYVN